MRFVRYEVNYFNAKPDIPIIVICEINMLWSRVSKADERSNRIRWQHVLLFIVDNIVLVIQEESCFVRMILTKCAFKQVYEKIIFIYMGDKLFEINSF